MDWLGWLNKDFFFFMKSTGFGLGNHLDVTKAAQRIREVVVGWIGYNKICMFSLTFPLFFFFFFFFFDSLFSFFFLSTFQTLTDNLTIIFPWVNIDKPLIVIWKNLIGAWRLRSYPCENTRSHPNSEVKHMWAGLVEWWVTTFESPVLKTFLFLFCFFIFFFAFFFFLLFFFFAFFFLFVGFWFYLPRIHHTLQRNLTHCRMHNTQITPITLTLSLFPLNLPHHPPFLVHFLNLIDFVP